MHKNIVPIEALFNERAGGNLDVDRRQVVAWAEVIFGLDVTSGDRFIIFGRKTLEQSVRSGKPRDCRVTFISLDRNSKEFEKLLALVREVKGYVDC